MVRVAQLQQRRMAVVGAGIAGLGAALRLADRGASVTLLESRAQLGGHASTRSVEIDGQVHPVDIGFIVFNHHTYPLLSRLFERLDVPSVPTTMSFSVSCDECGLTYAGGSGAQLVRSILRRPATIRLFAGVVRFGRLGRRALRAGLDDDISLAQWAHDVRLHPRVITHYLVPLTAAVWSTAPGTALELPAATTLQFLDNHGLLLGNRPQWRTVRGGSVTYVDAVAAQLAALGVEIRTTARVTAISRSAGAVTVRLDGGELIEFDAIVVATHAPDALRMLSDPTELEASVLGSIDYTDNEIVLHDDPTPLPDDERLWAAWNYRLADCAARSGPPALTYQMNLLQHLPRSRSVSVSVNPSNDAVGSQHRLATEQFAHPRYDVAARAAQRRVAELHAAGAQTRTWYCGAWQGHGFHEDGIRSGYLAADAVLA